MEWYTRDMIWKPASPEQINSVTNYLTTNQATQKIGLFKDLRHIKDVIYTIYDSGNTLVELLYDTPLHIEDMNDLSI